MRDFFKKFPKFYYFVMYFFGPSFLYFYSSKYFIKKYGADGECLNLGSGPLRVHPNFKNVDLLPFVNVDIVCNLTETPFPDSTVDKIVIDNVLEHVPKPKKVVEEMYRIMKSGSTAYISVPFIYPFHSSPYDYQRWTSMGLKKLFEEFEILEFGTRSGIFSSLNTLLVYMSATIFSFGNKKLYELSTNLFIFIFFPIKFLDVLTLWIPQNSDSACVFYMIVKKS